MYLMERICLLVVDAVSIKNMMVDA